MSKRKTPTSGSRTNTTTPGAKRGRRRRRRDQPGTHSVCYVGARMPKPLNPGPSGVPLGYKSASPGNPVDARKWIQEAIRTECYTATNHVRDRLRERGLSMDDLRHAVAHPRKVEPYSRMPQHGGTCWRLYGRDLDDEQEVGVGFEAYMDERGRWAVLCTIFALEGR